MAFDPNEHLIQLKGKDYLPVQWRLVWLREVAPDARITTACVAHTDTFALFHATIMLSDGAVASGHGSETKADFGDFIEKAETKAIGRALAALGFGTQFAADLDEGQRIVDSPVERKPAPARTVRPPQQPDTSVANDSQRDWYRKAMAQLHFDVTTAIQIAEDIGAQEWYHLPPAVLQQAVAAAKLTLLRQDPVTANGHRGTWRIVEPPVATPSTPTEAAETVGTPMR